MTAPLATSPRTAPPPIDCERLLLERHAGARVLLVEDHPLNLEIAQLLLEAAGLVVDLATDGQQAVEMVAATPYRLVLMDLQMPRMDGQTATRAIRTQHTPTQLPIVAMTACVTEDEAATCRAAGMNDLLKKPFGAAQLYERTLHWLSPGAPALSAPTTAGRPLVLAP